MILMARLPAAAPQPTRHDGFVPYNLVSFHAHPDDEALYTGGTLARAAAEGHRVVIVTATDGAAGLAPTAAGAELGQARLAELRRAAAALGVTDVRHLGYDDSGLDGRAGRPGRAFARCDPEEAAGRLAAVLDEMGAHALTIYDPAGGYGHPDHKMVHVVGVRAARRAGTPVVLEATVDRRSLARVLRWIRSGGLVRLLGVDGSEWDPQRFARAYRDRSEITHRVDVRRHCAAKRRALAAHGTQSGGGGVRTLAVLSRLPAPLFRLVLGREWFVEHGRRPSEPPLDDIFASLRGSRPAR
jgi:LmbE family N-acetylglucosaminyl deacetylase